MSSDSEIILRSRDTPAAFAELYDRHAAIIHRYAARRVGETAADDIMSETFLVAFQRRSAFDPAWDDARPWLYGIATNLVKKHARLEAIAWKGMIADGAAAIDRDVIDALGSRVDAERAIDALANAMRRLSARDRDALLLYAWGDLDYEGVAQAMGVPIGTIRSRLNRARRLLRANDQKVEHGRIDPAAQRA